ncbi:MAG: DUF2807 domain-containing protein [Cytophagales bacterium]|nr:DUF2807 domain-containing protein [Cytophagales bacterium]
MRTLLFAWFSMLIPLLSTGQETRSLDAFTSVRVSGNIKVSLTKGNKNSVQIQTNEALSPSDVLTRVKGGILKISLKTKIYKNADARVALTYKELQKLHAGSSARIRSDEPLKSESLELSTASSGKLRMALEVKFLNASTGTGGEMQLSGKAGKLDAVTSSGGSFDAYDLKAMEVYVKANTGGIAEVNAKEYLEAKAATGGAVYYRGNPKKVMVNKNLGGKIVKR